STGVGGCSSGTTGISVTPTASKNCKHRNATLPKRDVAAEAHVTTRDHARRPGTPAAAGARHGGCCCHYVMQDFGSPRNDMVRTQLAARGIRDPRVLQAFEAVPRERFVAPELAEFAYEDAPLPIEEGQTISQPFIVALMVAALEVRETDRVLEIGTGSG